jgi:hypothetical protein
MKGGMIVTFFYVDWGRFWNVSSTGCGRSSLAVLVCKRGEAIGGYCGRGQVEVSLGMFSDSVRGFLCESASFV